MLKVEQSVLLVVDIQGKLAEMMAHPHYLKRVRAMIEAAHLLDVPILLTEQVPEKIGSTISPIKDLLPEVMPIKKTSFSCAGEPAFLGALSSLERQQIIVVGIEAHVCIHQSVYDLVQRQFDVHVIADAVSARTMDAYDIALKRMQQDGARLSTAEMAVCEWGVGADHPKFKHILDLMKSGL